jgi:branched-chain amino acid transport system ATP-binding protein
MADRSPSAGPRAPAPVQILEVAELHVRYGRIRALKGVSLSIAPGEIVAILGANGAGKSTLMRALAGLETVRKGQILFGGVPIARRPAHSRARIGMSLVLEGRSVFAPLTVKENLRLGMFAEAAIGKQELFKERTDFVLGVFPALRERLRVRAGELSGGQQQMLAIARALMSKPSFLMLDEPSVGLAPLIVEELFHALVELNRSTGLTILLAEQNIENALAIADRGYVFEVGEVVMEDTADKLIDDRGVEDVYLGRREGAGS